MKTHLQFVFTKTGTDAMQRVTRCAQTSGDALPLDDKFGNQTEMVTGLFSSGPLAGA